MKWNSLSVIDLDPQSEESGFVIKNPVVGRKARIPSDALLSLLRPLKSEEGQRAQLRLTELGFFNEDDPKFFPGMAHWWKRQWGPSLEYYLWSRHSSYADQKDPEHSKRTQTIRSYLRADSVPKRHRLEGSYRPLFKAGDLPSGISFSNLLKKRRTHRSFTREVLALSQLEQILWFGLDRVRRCRQSAEHDPSPLGYLTSFGVAFDFYVATYHVDSLDAGIHHLDLERHEIVKLDQKLDRGDAMHILQSNFAPSTASFTIFIVADFAQYQWRYRHERAMRNLMIDAGRIAHDLNLVGELLGLGSLCTPAIRDRELLAKLELPLERFAPIYSLTMGLKRKE